MHRLVLILLAISLAACAAETSSPSLARRPIEGRDLSEPSNAATPPAAASAELKSQIDGLVAQAREGQNAFAALLSRTESAATAARAEGSESWVAAQQLLSALEAARAPSTRALASIDALIAERLNGGREDGLIELQAASAEASTLVEAQQRTIDRLRERIAG